MVLSRWTGHPPRFPALGKAGELLGCGRLAHASRRSLVSLHTMLMKHLPKDNLGQHDTTVIRPPRGWRLPDLLELWAYRDVLRALAVRDVKVRYKQTMLGVTWAILQPLATMILFTLIFGRFAKIPSEGYPYAVFVYAGLLPWTLFSSIVTASANSLVGASGLVTKVYFPRLLVPGASIGSPLVDFLVSSVILLALMLVYGVGWTWNLAMAPVLVGLTVITAVGVGTFLSAVIVTYRDFRFVLAFMMQFWMFATPVIYPPTMIPEEFRWILALNPMTGVVDGFRSAFLGKAFDLVALSMSLGTGLTLLFLGVMYFQKVEDRFADVI